MCVQQPQQKGLPLDNAGRSHGSLAHVLKQGLHNCANYPDRDSAPIRRAVSKLANKWSQKSSWHHSQQEKASSRWSSKIVWKCDPTGLAAVLLQNSRVRRHQKACSSDNHDSSSNIALGVACLIPQMYLLYLS